MAFLVTTTGTVPTVVLNDLGGRTVTHPTSGLDLEGEYTPQELSNSIDLQGALGNGYITAVDENGTPVVDSRAKTHYQQYTESLLSGGHVDLTHAEDPGGSNSKRSIQASHWTLDLGANLAIGWTPYDPMGYSTYEDRINDGSFTTYWYNNSSLNPDGKWVGLDAGAPVSVRYCKWYDYTSSIYQALHYRIDGSNDGTNWTTIVDVSTPPPHSPPPDGFLLDLGSTVTYRYYRYYCVDGENANYILLYELEFYHISSPPFLVDSVLEGDYSVRHISSTVTRITNLASADRDYVINIWVPRN